VTLTVGAEPTTETDLGLLGDGSAAPSESNLTVDFGFSTVVPPVGTPPSPSSSPGNPGGPDILLFDPAVSKIGILQDNGTGLVGERLEWVVTVSNQGSVAGTNIQITDTISDDSRIDSVSFNGPYQINGQTVVVTIARLDPGQSIQFSIFVTILRSPFDHDNEIFLTAPGLERSTVGHVVSQLPSTGESPLWRDLVIVLLVGLSVSASAYVLSTRRRTG
jgi:uncharacterized repeat protein (TIGR01451 family)